MNATASIVKQHPVLSFFVLAYALSWGSFLLLSGPSLFVFGPFLAALLVAGVTRGRDGLSDLLSRCLRWRVGPRWYAAALLLPVAVTLSAVGLNVLLGAPAPTAAQLGPWYSLFLLFPMAMIDAPLAEETGWRGYALPHLRLGSSRLATTLILGLLLAGWHLPVALSGGALAVPYLIAGIGAAVLNNWVYYHGRESALLAILYHSAQNCIGGFYLFPLFSGPEALRLWWLYAAVYSLAAIALVAADRRTWLSRRPVAAAPASIVPAPAPA